MPHACVLAKSWDMEVVGEDGASLLFQSNAEMRSLIGAPNLPQQREWVAVTRPAVIPAHWSTFECFKTSLGFLLCHFSPCLCFCPITEY